MKKEIRSLINRLATKLVLVIIIVIGLAAGLVILLGLSYLSCGLLPEAGSKGFLVITDVQCRSFFVSLVQGLSAFFGIFL
jgi:hypothetical protein